MDRNSDLPVRQPEGLSVAWDLGTNRTGVNNYFKILQKILVENDLLSKSQNKSNMDETGFDVNNEPG
jgi:hypothetical protein